MALTAAPDSGSDWEAALAWASSGVMALTGWPEGAPVVPPTALPALLDALVAEIGRRTADRGRPVLVSWAAALSGRAALLGLTRRGQVSPNGSCRLLQAANGWVALNLPRIDDVDLIPALIGRATTEPWADAVRAAASVPAADFAGRARLLGLAAAPLPGPGEPIATEPYTVFDRGGRRSDLRHGALRVVDLSSLWAGPVVARVLSAAGATVSKLESPSRPDGARRAPAFYRWVHQADEVTAPVDLRSDAGRRQAAHLIEQADVVIEASRPRALEQLGLAADDLECQAGQVWLSITGYGRGAPGRDWVAFGDDAAVAGGLVGWDKDGEPVFCGDAIADPLTGLVGALAVLRALDAGGGQVIDLAMSRVAATAPSLGPVRSQLGGRVTVRSDGSRGWRVRAGSEMAPVLNGPPTVEWVRSG